MSSGQQRNADSDRCRTILLQNACIIKQANCVTAIAAGDATVVSEIVLPKRRRRQIGRLHAVSLNSG